MNPRETTVYGSLLHEDTQRQRRVRVELRPKDIDKATEAWRRDWEVAVTGDLEPRGTSGRMRRVTAFAGAAEVLVGFDLKGFTG
ncbi:hypothetical protein QQY66_24805 [Streptomyces sp. DG2A-72]|uniref:hypothetical protein n=1 Tax=Streptomyces sp. DG2A-72 TaxID=3051386 RepID=UPI00265BA2A9|nr:hypothetical protein [Streptomyces sp. DG2A-72]MDO0934744.1 hypothetical protein [Streptomyces sp. DG2A-72]